MKTSKTEMVFFDTNVYVNLLRSPEYLRKIERFLQGSHLYVVNKIVLMELWAGVKSDQERKIIEEQQNSTTQIGMTDDNFILAGQILRELSDKYGSDKKMRRQLTWDILIALSARENRALLITENRSDFQKINRFVDFEFICPS